MVRAAGCTSCCGARSLDHSALALFVARRKRFAAIAVALRDRAVLVPDHQLGMTLLRDLACARDRVGLGFMQRSGAVAAVRLHRPPAKRPRLDCNTPSLWHRVFLLVTE